ncbi:MAG: hypothetical protein HXX18_11295 [Bacteroidetes bacterium]|nr:hypothetical protein [Bacteroidota bacterium]
MKKMALIFFSFFICNIAFCQEDKADYNDDYWSFGTKDVADFNTSESLKEINYFKTNIINYPIENNILGKGKYLNGKKEGEWTGLYKDDKPYFIEWYSKGKLKKGESYDIIAGKKYFYTKEIIYAHPQNGWDDFVTYAQNYWNKVSDFIENRYPENFKLLRNKEIEVSFVILFYENGTVDIGDIANGTNFGFDKTAAKKMLSNYKNKWIPAVFKGQVRKSKAIYSVIIQF